MKAHQNGWFFRRPTNAVRLFASEIELQSEQIRSDPFQSVQSVVKPFGFGAEIPECVAFMSFVPFMLFLFSLWKPGPASDS